MTQLRVYLLRKPTIKWLSIGVSVTTLLPGFRPVFPTPF
jgi:hypothetical protein